MERVVAWASDLRVSKGRNELPQTDTDSDSSHHAKAKGEATGRQSEAAGASHTGASSKVATLEGITSAFQCCYQKGVQTMRQSFNPLRVTIEKYKEKNCCTVVALACSMDWSFGKALRHMAKHGRKPRRGMYSRQWVPAMQDAAEQSGKTTEQFTQANGLTINRFTKEYPKGVYFIQVSGHALAIVDGKIQDWTANTAGRRKIQDCYKIEG